MVLESGSRRLHTYWSFFFKLVLHSFQIDIAIFQCTKSGHTFFTEYHMLWKMRFGITDIGGLYVKKCQTHVLAAVAALCLLYFFQRFRHWFVLKSAASLRKLDEFLNEIQNCPQPMPKSLSIWFLDFSQFGGKKAGTSRSHDVGCYELD